MIKPLVARTEGLLDSTSNRSGPQGFLVAVASALPQRLLMLRVVPALAEKRGLLEGSKGEEARVVALAWRLVTLGMRRAPQLPSDMLLPTEYYEMMTQMTKSLIC